MKIWLWKGGFIIFWGIKIIINFNSILLNICTLFAYCGFEDFFLFYLHQENSFFHFPTFLNNPCSYFLFDWRISVTMITMNIITNVCFKHFRHSTTIGMIRIKINMHWPKIFINGEFYSIWVNKNPFPNDSVPKSSIMKK